MSDQTRITRRTFFAGLGLAAAAGVAAKVSAAPRLPEAAPPDPVNPKGGGYQLTEHVKKYYRTTTV